ncbi:MAG: hypothetical protein OWP43_00200 [Sphaerochaetaceae bacterium]|jgi:hypothetical protein|nr:hypothetical protein [Sphaerochaetaceae bacterium]MDC7242794.1 hypothetical protein [Sphaerochaetaceae bacterium]
MQFDETSKVIFLEELKKSNKKAVYFFIKKDCCSSTLNVDLTDEGIIEDVDGVPVVYGDDTKDALENAKFVVTEQGLSLIDLKPAESHSCSCGDDHGDEGCSCGDGGCGCH